MIDEQKLNEEYKKFVAEYIPECSTYEQIHKQIKDFKIIGGKEPTLKQKAFALMYRRYIDFPDNLPPNKKCSSPNFFNNISNCFFDSPLPRNERDTRLCSQFLQQTGKRVD